MRIAEKMADALKEKGLTQKEFAYKLGKKPSEVSRWLTGSMNLTHDTMYDIQSVLGIELMNTSSSNIREIPCIKLTLPIHRQKTDKTLCDNAPVKLNYSFDTTKVVNIGI
jgi:transcriptional regulator with XRE-family HTH domain